MAPVCHLEHHPSGLRALASAIPGCWRWRAEARPNASCRPRTGREAYRPALIHVPVYYGPDPLANGRVWPLERRQLVRGCPETAPRDRVVEKKQYAKSKRGLMQSLTRKRYPNWKSSPASCAWIASADPPARSRASGGALSAAEIMAVLYFHHLHVDLPTPIGSNVTASSSARAMPPALLYSTLARRGFFCIFRTGLIGRVELPAPGSSRPV